MQTNLAIVILNYNSYKLTINAARAILRLGCNVQIIIVDNCSKDESLAELNREFEMDRDVFIVCNGVNGGYAFGNNVGIRFARTLAVDTVLIMNPDIVINDVQVIQTLYQLLSNDDQIGAITVKTIYNGTVREPNECAWKFLDRRYMLFGGTLLKALSKPMFYKEFIENDCGYQYVDVVQGCFFMARLDHLEMVGLLDEHTFLYSEESILAKKFQNVGLQNAVVPSLSIHHNHIEKDRNLINETNKLFDMQCYYNSRKYYIKKYSGEPMWFKTIASIYLGIDYSIKRLLLQLTNRLHI